MLRLRDAFSRACRGSVLRKEVIAAAVGNTLPVATPCAIPSVLKPSSSNGMWTAAFRASKSVEISRTLCPSFQKGLLQVGFSKFHTSTTLAIRGPEPRDDTPPPPRPASNLNQPKYGCAGGGAPAFTPTSQLVKRKVYRKRCRFMLKTLEYEDCLQRKENRPFEVPAFRPGDVIEVKFIVPENQNRPASFRGVCIARRNKGIMSSFSLLNHIYGDQLERTFPLYSPHLLDMKILERRKNRRSKMYWLRDRKPKEYAV